MKQLILFLTLITWIGLTSCNTVKKADISLLENNWTHAYEEDKDGVRIFKPSQSQDFAPSMYRLNLVLKANNEAEYLVLSPVDAHFMETGKWKYNADTRELLITDNDNRPVHRYKVIEVTNNLLQMEEQTLQ